jgi:hypothetical protein
MKEARLFTLFQRLAKWYLAPKLATCQWFSIGTAVCSTNKTDPHDIAEMLLKVALSTVKQTSIFLWGLTSWSNLPNIFNRHVY